MGWWIALAVLVLLAALPLGVAVRYGESGVAVKVIAGPLRLGILPRKKSKGSKEEKQKAKPEEKEKTKKRKKTKYPPPTLETLDDPADPDNVKLVILQRWNGAERPQKRLLYLLANGVYTGKTVELNAQNKWSATIDGLERYLEGVEIAYTLTDQKPKGKSPKAGGSMLDFLPLLKVALELLDGLRRKLRVPRLEAHLVLAGDDPADLALNYGRACAAVANLIPRLERFLVIGKRDIQVSCDFAAEQTTIDVFAEIRITLGRLLWLVFYYAAKAAITFLKILLKRKGGAQQ